MVERGQNKGLVRIWLIFPLFC